MWWVLKDIAAYGVTYGLTKNKKTYFFLINIFLVCNVDAARSDSGRYPFYPIIADGS